MDNLIQPAFSSVITDYHPPLAADAMRQWGERSIKTPSEWAERHRWLPESAARPGPWRNDTVPYMTEVVDAMADPVIRIVALLKSVQVGGTASLLNYLGWKIDQRPGNILIIQPTGKLVARFSKDAISDLIAIPVIDRKLYKDKSKAAHQKYYPGGLLLCGSANSASDLSGFNAQDVMLDDIDRYPRSVDAEGDPITLALNRATTYGENSKLILISTPTISTESKIADWYDQSDRRRYHLPCPKCSRMQTLRWDNFRYKLNLHGQVVKSSIYMVCENRACAHEIQEADKPAMLQEGEWRATTRTKRDGLVGYHINALISPFRTWQNIAEEHANSRQDEAKRVAFTTQTLGEPHKVELYAPVITAKNAPREDYDRVRDDPDRHATMPGDTLLITTGVDTQAKRLEAHTYAWINHNVCHCIERVIFPGAIQDDKVWWDYAEWLVTARYIDHYGRQLAPAAVGQDSGGGDTSRVYAFAYHSQQTLAAHKKRMKMRHNPPLIYALKGIGGWDRVMIRRSPNPVRKELPGPLPLYQAGVDPLKKETYARIDRRQLITPKAWPGGEEIPAAWYKQLTAEKLEVIYQRGRAYPRFTNMTGARNEALDCAAYALAMKELVMTRLTWQQLSQIRRRELIRIGAIGKKAA